MTGLYYTEKELKNEIWKPVVGFELLYSVSNLGRFRRDKANRGAKVGHILKQRIRSGYWCLELRKDADTRSYIAHRLICKTFHGLPPTPKHEVNHIDPDKLNNRADNLEWVTRSENLAHRKLHGLEVLGERRALAKLKDADIPVIRRRLANGETAVAISKDYPVTSGTISKIKRGERFTHIP